MERTYKYDPKTNILSWLCNGSEMRKDGLLPVGGCSILAERKKYVLLQPRDLASTAKFSFKGGCPKMKNSLHNFTLI